MYIEQVPNCCTATMLYNFVKDPYWTVETEKRSEASLTDYLQLAHKLKLKIIHAYLTDQQKKAIKLLKKHGFKRAGRKDTRPDRHNTKLYLYYLILEDK